ncbi:site-specific integrase [Photobacterium indicum]|uniref:Site-specific integrase n=1 Tax=Photobacterium indicum TaxID=81447 RepID=A0A2T3L8L9_9GAMM|nr:site-specific integrase [Photobacterium indicum]PSV47321.1 site-specific integrase [Photobacterium indicum]
MRSNAIAIPSFDCFSAAQKKVINALEIPNKFVFMAADEFDDKYVKTTGDSWKFRYSGADLHLDFSSFECGYQKKLCKYLIRRYVIDHIPFTTKTLLYGFKQIFIWLKEQGASFSEKTFIPLLQSGEYSSFKTRNETFFYLLFMLRELGSIDFPAIGEDIEDDLVVLPRPDNDNWGIYQNAGEAIHERRISQVVKGLWRMSNNIQKGTEFSKMELRNNSYLGIAYVAGPRATQFDKLKVSDFNVDTIRKAGKATRYSLKIPYAKKGRVVDVTERMDIALPEEVGVILETYISAHELDDTDKLFPSFAQSSDSINKCISKCLDVYCQDDVKISLSQFRHNAAHSLAMRGASAEDIAYILGHTSLVVARHYIMATPELALVRLRALGMNQAWKSIIQLMTTGELVFSDRWTGRKVAGVIGGQLHYHVGGCDRDCAECPFAEVRSCYSCLFFRPFIDGDHLAVLYSIQKEIVQTVTLSDDIGDMGNPVIPLLTVMRGDVMSVMKRLEKRYGKGFGNYNDIEFVEVQ